MKTVHMVNGDAAGELLRRSGVPGEVVVWRDMLYDGPRAPGWPDAETLKARALFLQDATGGGVGLDELLENLEQQYAGLEKAKGADEVVLWFDACLHDQSVLCHILACMSAKGAGRNCSLICVDHFPGIDRFIGLGQLLPDQLASLYPTRSSVTEEQLRFAEEADRAFASQGSAALERLAGVADPPLPWVPAAAKRWLQEQPGEESGLGLLERLVLEAVHSGCEKPGEIFAFVAARDTAPQFWGDIYLWKKINELASRRPPLLTIDGPTRLLPQWDCQKTIGSYRIYPCEG